MKKKPSKARKNKYEQKLKVKGSLEDLLKELLHAERKDDGAKNSLPKLSGHPKRS
jgi:hypothetical protein